MAETLTKNLTENNGDDGDRSREEREKRQQPILLEVDADHVDGETVKWLQSIVGAQSTHPDSLTLKLSAEGLALVSDGQILRGDFTRLRSRLKGHNLSQELVVRAAKIKHTAAVPTVLDATAGLGEDSFLLAAAGFQVTLYERNPILYALLCDALKRAAQIPELAEIAARMKPIYGDSMAAMAQLSAPPDVILLDPMFPARQKSALVKKKLQVIQKLELPCSDERALLLAAAQANPKKLVIKRPAKGPELAGIKPDYALHGKAIRFDCLVAPYSRLQKEMKNK